MAKEEQPKVEKSDKDSRNLVSRLSERAVNVSKGAIDVSKNVASFYVDATRNTIGRETPIGRRVVRGIAPLAVTAVVAAYAIVPATVDGIGYDLSFNFNPIPLAQEANILNVATNEPLDAAVNVYRNTISEAIRDYNSGDRSKSQTEATMQEAYDLLFEHAEGFDETTNFIEEGDFEVYYTPGDRNLTITFPGEESRIEAPSNSLCEKLYELDQEGESLAEGDRAILNSNECQTELSSD